MRHTHNNQMHSAACGRPQQSTRPKQTLVIGIDTGSIGFDNDRRRSSPTGGNAGPRVDRSAFSIREIPVKTDRVSDAPPHLQQVVALGQDVAESYNNLGAAHSRALQIYPYYADARKNPIAALAAAETLP